MTELRRLGVTTCYKTDGQLMQGTNLTEEELTWILLYADVVSLACNDAEKLRTAVTTIDATILLGGLHN